ncbi:hypothetical protein [Modestobacter sp. SYSU DS0290]
MTNPRQPARHPSVRSRLAASAVTLAVAGGVVGLATFGQFTSEDTGLTRSVVAPIGP